MDSDSPFQAQGSSLRQGRGLQGFSLNLGEVERHGVKHKIGDGSLLLPQGPGMGRAVGVENWELFGELGKEPLAGALEAAVAAQCGILARRNHFESRFTRR